MEWFYLGKKTALELGAKQQSASSKLLVSTQETRVESVYSIKFQRTDETATEATATEWADGISNGCCSVDRLRTASYLASGLKQSETIQ